MAGTATSSNVSDDFEFPAQAVLRQHLLYLRCPTARAENHDALPQILVLGNSKKNDSAQRHTRHRKEKRQTERTTPKTDVRKRVQQHRHDHKRSHERRPKTQPDTDSVDGSVTQI